MIHLASILLEPNRWKPGRVPSIRVSAWSERARVAGFDGWELFENHYQLAPADEQAALRASPLPVRVFNSYASFDATGAAARETAVAAARAVGARGMKFNVGNEPARLDQYLAAIRETAAQSGDAVRLWCECHPDTCFEEPTRVLDAAAGAGWREWPFDVIIHPFLLGPEEVLRWGQCFGSRLRHAHVQMRAVHDPRRFLRLADDAPRARECLAALAQTAFAGSFSVEFAAPTGTSDDVPERLFAAACEDLEFLRGEWKPGAERATTGD